MSEQYKQAGVDIEAGYEAVERMKSHVQKTMRKEVMNPLGGFGGAFDLSQLNMKAPVLVSGTDGVGTKLKLAIDANIHGTIGVDAVAMCVNDIITTGAEPLYFLDYLALNKVVPEHVEQIVKGVADGCVQSECALIGGETAEMGEMYGENEYDIAGFAVGAVEKDQYIDGRATEAGDVIIGLHSSGVHSNGYSLVRKILNDNNTDLNERLEDKTLIEHLLEPTKIYVRAIKALKEEVSIKAMSHITGGGFYENIPRAIPEHFGVKLDVSNVRIPKIINWLINIGEIDKKEAYNVFNMGIGFIVVVSSNNQETAIDALKLAGEDPVVIGTVTDTKGVEINGI
ncbi:phosphoribosylformylglycinamidine cyclo-ligase [Aliicoccus persicus]|uniref:Phosphoribosylformylglycinamidine cyclo-ligase n=1 Tax=Aliicoccus persicus TaxID=930138 RepID=A0A662Z4S6_9STAP|nr:phosphoribosylformylglycinamidine cyclo-ligase [Aliicoccus persicus]SEW03558.1 phosphoribosylformylglycinamidine cyclo-ligase [Aliicoccus persicus]